MLPLAQTMNPFRYQLFILSVLLTPLWLSRANGSEPPTDWISWKAKRLESVAGTNGWTTVTGLHWLKEGVQTVGSNPDMAIRLPEGRAPGRVGEFIRSGGKVRFVAETGVAVSVDGKSEKSQTLRSDKDGKPSILIVGPFRITVLERGDRRGIRVRDPASAARQNFRSLDYFDYRPDFRIAATFVPYRPAKLQSMLDVTGVTTVEKCPGRIQFRWKGQDYSLDVLEDAEERDFLVLFRDATNGNSTYASGRYLHVALPDERGRVTIDFNFSYNPPCAFTAFATCQLAPSQNQLPFAIEAGEKRYNPRH